MVNNNYMKSHHWWRRNLRQQKCNSTEGYWECYEWACEYRRSFREIENEKDTYTKIRNKQLEFLGCIIVEEGLENLTLTGHAEGKRVREKQRMT